MKIVCAAVLFVGLVAIGTAAGDATPTTGPYDETAIGCRWSSAGRDALKRAAKEGRHVLLVFGANWCSDCRALDALLKSDKAIAVELAAHFVIAKIDVGKGPDALRNETLVKRFDVAVDTGIPVLVVVDANGRLLNNTKKERLADTDHQHPAKVLAFLKKWAP